MSRSSWLSEGDGRHAHKAIVISPWDSLAEHDQPRIGAPKHALSAHALSTRLCNARLPAWHHYSAWTYHTFQCLQTSTLSVDKSWDNVGREDAHTAKCLPRQHIVHFLTSSDMHAIGMKTLTNQAIDSSMFLFLPMSRGDKTGKKHAASAKLLVRIPQPSASGSARHTPPFEELRRQDWPHGQQPPILCRPDLGLGNMPRPRLPISVNVSGLIHYKVAPLLLTASFVARHLDVSRTAGVRRFGAQLRAFTQGNGEETLHQDPRLPDERVRLRSHGGSAR